MTPAQAAIVCSKEDSGERFWKLRLLTRESGGNWALMRKSSKNRSPDLFENIEVSPDKPSENGSFFIKEYRLQQSRSGIATSYAHFLCASSTALFLFQNSHHLEHYHPVYQLLGKALDALNHKNSDPQATYFKTLYLFLKEEGYPIKEDWWHCLPPADRQAARTLLQTPSQDIDPQHIPLLRLTQSMERWIRQHTACWLPPA